MEEGDWGMVKCGERAGERERGRRGRGGALKPWFPLIGVQQEEQNNHVKQTVKGINTTTPSGKPLWYP